ncbi:MAG: hypothetical protein CMJ78_08350 [Planctomycetaceae bacterium]|nr:hypothetical protein [Planctomycetaceae bacterium]
MRNQRFSSRTECPSFRQAATCGMSRRELLKVGGLSLLSPALIDIVARQASAAVKKSARIKSCLVLFQAGGVSQIDTVDMRPNASDNIRGEFNPIGSKVASMPVCEHLPMLAQQMDKICVVRSMYHRMLCHNPACYSMLAGRDVGESKAVSNQTPATQNDYPNFGSAVAKFRPAPADLPSFVSLPFTLYNGPAKTPGQNAGMLGSHYDPFLIEKDPSGKDFRVDELYIREQMNQSRYRDRQSLLATLDKQLRRIEETHAIDQMDTYFERAFSLLTTPRSRAAFDLSSEPAKLRARYGNHQTGQATLLARRLIEAGVPFVTVYAPVDHIEAGSWDTHKNNFPMLKDTLLPPADQSFSALLEDMHQRGLLDETLVVWTGEFGRTPKIGYTQSNNTNNSTGRDHHPYCYSLLLAGAGVQGGSYFGKSDKDGWYPSENPVHPGDLGATIYDAFGIDPHQEIRDPFGRPHRLIEGRTVPNLF